MRTVAVIAVLLLFPVAGMAQQQLTTPHAAAISKWQALLPAINRVLEEHNLKCNYQSGGWVTQIVDAADFSSADDVSVALVNWCYGGAYTAAILAMNLERGRPVLSRFRNYRGERMEFLKGASVMHSVGVELVPGKNAIYEFHSDNDQTGQVQDCGIKAYVWSTKTKTFSLDTELSKRATRSRCQRGG